jgi:hypothetical protein
VTLATSLVSLFGTDPAIYRPHELHAPDRAFRETNCYADIVIELLHARGDDPLAALGATIRTDFEGDQWTFFKPPFGDLETLFGIDIHEMQPYRPLPEQISQQLREGRTLIVEVDAWNLPDTAGTSYRSEHVKTSIAPEAIDLESERLRYFHNCSLFELAGDDYCGSSTSVRSSRTTCCRRMSSSCGSTRASVSRGTACVRRRERCSSGTSSDGRVRTHSTASPPASPRICLRCQPGARRTTTHTRSPRCG